MLRKLLFTLCIMLTSWSLAFAQQGRLKGVITDKTTGETIPFANVVLESGGVQVGGASSDFDGNYDINPIPPGTYDLKATFVGYNTFIMKGVVISPNKITFQPISLSMQSEVLDAVEIVDYKVPLISKDQTSSGATITAEEIAKMPSRSASAVAATVGGVFSQDGEVGNMRGARSEGTVYYVDGVRVIGSSSVPQSAIDQVEVMLSGTPAMYGDATGGIINMTTKGPSRQFGFGVELEQSLDKYGHSRAGLNLQGPLIKNRKTKETIVGFFLAGEFNYDKDGAISAIGHYKATDDWLNSIKNTPLRIAGANNGVYPNGEFTRMGSMEYIKNSMNTSNWDATVTGNLNIRTTETINLIIGGNYNKSRGHGFSRAHEYFNYDKNYIYEDQTWRVYGRFSQRFPTDPESTSVFKNFYYSLQVDYSRYNSMNYDPDHQKDIWKYGYLGKYSIYKTPTYELGSADVTIRNEAGDSIGHHTYDNVWVLNSWDNDTLVTFQPGTYNPLLARYTSQIYDLYTDPYMHYDNLNNLQLNMGLLNSQSPSAFYGLYAAPGTVQANYAYSESDLFNISLATAMTIGNHELKIGFQYEQRNSRSYGVAGSSLWYMMRNLANFHIDQLDMSNPEIVSYDGFVDTIIYKRKYNESDQYVFDANLRKALGLNVDGTDWINTDSYDFNDNSIEYYDEYGVMHKAILQDGYDISMFTPDELTQDGNSYVSYYGYDYKGNKLKSQPSFNDFFTEMDETGTYYTRPVGSYRPIYIAGYIQDKFDFKDLIFNIGVRVDRFDANQKILKDPYILYDYYTVGDQLSSTDNSKIELPNGTLVNRPSNIGNDFAMYVNKIDDITSIQGFRSGNTWYNAEGAEISDPTTLDAGAGVTAWVKDETQQHVDQNSFADYDPKWCVMPRISFSFPISDEALFFAHYDVLTQRPSNIYTNIYSYYYFSQISGEINNPALKPSQTIDYELGFTQKLTNTSSMTITAYYRELRDMIQLYRYTGAYPKDYTSYSNLDFGTVKGLTASYDLRRTKNVRLRASYTLQFTNATGASTTTMSALIAAGVPNLRSTFPMPWDRRHQFNVTLDYRFADGKDYNGPVSKREKSDKKPIQWLANTGLAITLQGGSGTPYTASSNINSPIAGNTSNILKGSYCGSRLPWAFRFDLRLDKDIYFKANKEKDGREAYLNVYLQVLNVFNSKNVKGVYASTGNPDDDGYLSAPEWQREINTQTDADAYCELYSLYVNNFYNYSSPRQFRIGVIFNF
ncbi:MAG: carboxypeptidase-like regulatory domain-containing protein [Bacteroidales bacterium]|nr:carboxypeptidase-like regulatory domain-containing protein [Bacteroidales bacterium]